MLQSIKTIVKISVLIFPIASFAQSSYLTPGSKDYTLLDRLEIKTYREGLNASYIKPYNRKLMVEEVQSIDSMSPNAAANFSAIDRYNMSRFLMAGKEWTNPNSSYYKKKGVSLIEVNKPNFFWTLDPAIAYEQSFESYDSKSVYIASAGITTRGVIAKKLGFSFYMTGNEERTPYYVRQWSDKFHAVPGFSNLTVNSNGSVKYFDVRGSLNWNVAKFIDMQAGYDRNFLGNGQRSLWLSDFSGNMLFFKINTRLWKFDFENLYMKLIPQFGIVGEADEKKFLRINTLSFNATKWLNIGVFDAVVFGREKQFELNYLQPFTFLRAMEQQSGSPDNALLGLNVKVNMKRCLQLYGQFALDEFLLHEMTSGNGWWANKYGYQFGVKYLDAFHVNNLDLQLELNRMRPFTYTHFDSVSNYSHANQPLAHQLGANFNEVLLIAKYQPLKKLFMQAKLMYYYQGMDSAGVNMGNNILIDYNNRPRNYGWNIGTGDKATCIYANLNASYEVIENLIIDAGVTLRNYKLESGYKQNTTMFTIGFRWNIARREFDF